MKQSMPLNIPLKTFNLQMPNSFHEPRNIAFASTRTTYNMSKYLITIP